METTQKRKRFIRNKPPKHKKKVFVALSGGVDSSVAAALLKKQGYEVTGVFMQNWSDEKLSNCPYKEDRDSAMRVAARLDIPFFTWNFEKEYKERVVDYMIQGYQQGSTPNPDVMCNKEIKFDMFLKRALNNGADFIATGHYAKLKPQFHTVEQPGYEKKTRGVTYRLYKADDKKKDQSYFLWTLTQEQLKHIIFPLGEYEKPEVRKLAAQFNLPTAHRKDSQGICFVGMVDLPDFLAHWIEPRAGKIVDLDTGEEYGTHEGVWFYTIGQRHGLGIGGRRGQEEGEALFVAKKDIGTNTLYVVKGRDNRALFTRDVVAEKTNWIAGYPKRGGWYKARVRYRGDLGACFFEIEHVGRRHRRGDVVISFKTPQWGVASGQSVVFYDNKGEMMGGGVIKGTANSREKAVAETFGAGWNANEERN